MTQSPYASSFVDHYLQSAILERLAQADQPLRFSQIKEDGIENSLFMYHMNKLIRRGIVQKSEDQRFSLTPKGAQWINFTGLRSATVLLPRPLVQVIIQTDTHLLLAKRTGQMSNLLNTYMLPGTLHEYGETAESVAVSYLQERFTSLTLQTSYLTFAEVILHDDTFTHHTLSSLFLAQLIEPLEPAPHSKFAYEWHDRATISKENSTFADASSLFRLLEVVGDEI